MYGEEENYAFANEFFKHTVNESQDLAGGPRIQMHNKTVNWVKKAAGLQRPYDPLEHQQSLNLSDSDEGETVEPKASPRRRLTRGMARNTRVKRRQERIRKETEGINALAAAVQEIEEERGESFPSSKRFVSLYSSLLLFSNWVGAFLYCCSYILQLGIYRSQCHQTKKVQTRAQMMTIPGVIAALRYPATILFPLQGEHWWLYSHSIVKRPVHDYR